MLDVYALNVAAPTKNSAAAILAHLWPREDDVWVLSELTDGAGSRLLLEVCRAEGFAVHAAHGTARERGVAVVVRSGLGVRAVSTPLGSRVVALDADGVRLIGVYGAASDPVRYSSAAQRERKRVWLERFTAYVDEQLTQPGAVVVAGDLNVADPDDDLPYVLPQERAAYERFVARGLVDAHRERHGSSRPTWIDHGGAGCRYDYVLTRGLAVADAGVDDAPREGGLSDHCGVAASLRWPDD